MKAKKDGSGQPENWKFASVCVLVVDEGSLVCVMLLHSILTMLTNHARLRKFILLGELKHHISLFLRIRFIFIFRQLSLPLFLLVSLNSWCAGDVRQLPSIMPGNTLHDLFHSLTLAKYAIEMRTNHRAESELIVNNSGQ